MGRLTRRNVLRRHSRQRRGQRLFRGRPKRIIRLLVPAVNDEDGAGLAMLPVSVISLAERTIAVEATPSQKGTGQLQADRRGRHDWNNQSCLTKV